MDDYFAGSTRPAQPAAPPQPPAAPYPHAQTWPQAPAWPGQPAPPFYAPPAPGMSAGAKVAIGIAVAVAGLFVIGILAAVAIPVFLDHRAKDEAARTTVSLPESIGGMARLTDANSAQLEEHLSSAALPGDHLAGVYGNGTMRVAVGVTKKYMSFAEQRGFLAGAQREAQGDGVTFADTDAGSLGGTMRCGSYTARVTTCLFVDAGAYGTVLVIDAAQDPIALARTARAAVEHRA
jgi:hypothetical protein